MATKTWAINFDSYVISTYPTSNYAALVALWADGGNQWISRSFLQFYLDWTGVKQITSAVLHIHVNSFEPAYPSGPGRSHVARVVQSWTERGVTWNNQPDYSDATWADTGYFSSPGWITVDITRHAEFWAPASVKQRDGSAGYNQPNYGVRISQYDEANPSQGVRYDSSETSYDPYIVLTYSSNSAPTAPTMVAPANGAVLTTLTPTFQFNQNDPDPGDTISKYDIYVSTSPGFEGGTYVWAGANQTAGISGSSVSRVYAGSALTPGVTYYWEVRTFDAAGAASPYAPGRSFVVNRAPTATVVNPTTGKIAALTYPAGSGWASPRPTVAWSFSDPDTGQTQSAYQVIVYNDSSGSPGTTLYDSGKVTSSATSLVVPATFTEGSYYHWKVLVYDSMDAASAFTATQRFRTRWGYARYRFDQAAAPVTWSIEGPTISGSGSITVEYNSADDTSDTNLAATWQPSLATITKRRYFTYRVWLLPSGNLATGVTPSLDDIGLEYSQSALTADRWTLATGASIEVGVMVYGTQSLRMEGASVDRRTYQQVKVLANTNYQLSGRIKANGNAQAKIAIGTTPTGGELVATSVVSATQEFTATHFATPWNSGVNTVVYVQCVEAGAAGTTAWFDALKLEAATTPTPWTPAFITTSAVTIDAGGIQVDGATGGIMRLKASAGGTRDRVDLGAHGLNFGGDATELSSPAAGSIKQTVPAATDAVWTVEGASAHLTRILAQVSGDTNPRAELRGDATATGLILGPGNAAADVRMLRSAVKTVTLDDGASGEITLLGLKLPRVVPVYPAANPSNTTLTAATTWYKTGIPVAAVTPAYTGQRFLILCTGAFTFSTTAFELDLGLRIDNDTSGTINKWLAVERYNVPNTLAQPLSIMGLFIAAAGDVSATRNIYLYAQCVGASGATLGLYGGSDYTSRIEVVALPGAS